MSKNWHRLILCALLALATPFWVQEVWAQEEPVRLADPFVGADGGGNTVPGAGVPFGFVSLSPDTAMGDTSGYDSSSAITGFSFTHVTGTGGKSKYGNFRVTPLLGDLGVSNLVFARSDETASPGYYAVSLGADPARRIRVELTATRLAGLMRVTFPKGQGPARLVLDATSVIALRGEGQRVTGAHVDILDAQTVSGWVSVEGGWNPAPYKLYFYARYSRSAQDFGAWRARQGELMRQAGPGALDGEPQAKTAAAKADLMVDYDTHKEFAHRLGAYAGFDADADPSVELKLAVSFIGVEKAKDNLEREIPGWDFEAVRAAAESQWRDALGRIEVSGGDDAQRRIFYSALYRSHTMPHDLSGENVWWASSEPHYEDFYTLWDTFRTLHPLLTIIEPERQRDMVRSLLDTYRHTGWLPDARIAGANGMTQGGSNGDVVIADAIVKDLGGFDPDLAYAAIKKDADIDSDAPFIQGRVLKDYLRLGYVPLTETRSASRTLEYAYDDFAVGEVAARLGHADDAARYRARSGNWRNIWDDGLGCVHPRYPDGRWLENYSCDYTYPDKTGPWWEAPFYEGNGLQYSTYVPQDIPGLIARVGGPAAFVGWLDHLFDGHYDQGNEPDILAPWLYIDAGRPDLSEARVRQILRDDYHLARDGLPGNDDAGTMSSWYVWSSLGLYPLAGQPVYYIGSPVFTRSVIHLAGGRSFTISAPLASSTNLYITGARLNGRPLKAARLSHAKLMAGGVLELDMGPKPNGWGQTPRGLQ
jgi:predicted alpha-1,2-mannosidase